MRHFKLTEEAERDLIEIGIHTEREWGIAQRDRYLKALDDRFHYLAEYPHFGKKRGDIKKGYYSYHQGKHVIFYIITENRIEIIGILHERMDFKRHL